MSADGKWFIPVLIGADTATQEDAIAYSIDHNLSSLWGSDIALSELVSLFDDDALSAQLELLQDSDSLPISVDEDDIDLLMGVDFPDYDDLGMAGADDSTAKDADSALEDFQRGVKRSIQIEFNPDDYDEALSLVSYFRRDKGVYVGGLLIQLLNDEKSKDETENKA